MPLYKDFSQNNDIILVWKYNSNDELNTDLIQKPDIEKVKHYPPKKILEYLIIRKMLKCKLPYHSIIYEENGEPILTPRDFEISITHSFPYAALAISTKKIGIDIEKVNPKILKIKHKFLNDEELIWTKNENELNYLTIIWTIKESLYKLHHTKYWSLKKHYNVKPFQLDNISKIECSVYDNNFIDNFSANVKKIDDVYFCVIK